MYGVQFFILIWFLVQKKNCENHLREIWRTLEKSLKIKNYLKICSTLLPVLANFSCDKNRAELGVKGPGLGLREKLGFIFVRESRCNNEINVAPY